MTSIRVIQIWATQGTQKAGYRDFPLCLDSGHITFVCSKSLYQRHCLQQNGALSPAICRISEFLWWTLENSTVWKTNKTQNYSYNTNQQNHALCLPGIPDPDAKLMKPRDGSSRVESLQLIALKASGQRIRVERKLEGCLNNSHGGSGRDLPTAEILVVHKEGLYAHCFLAWTHVDRHAVSVLSIST